MGKLESINFRLGRIEDRLNMLECDHSKVEYQKDRLGTDVFYEKQCSRCGKVLVRYMTPKEKLEDEIGILTGLLVDKRDELDKLC